MSLEYARKIPWECKSGIEGCMWRRVKFWIVLPPQKKKWLGFWGMLAMVTNCLIAESLHLEASFSTHWPHCTYKRLQVWESGGDISLRHYHGSSSGVGTHQNILGMLSVQPYFFINLGVHVNISESLYVLLGWWWWLFCLFLWGTLHDTFANL